MKIKYGIDNDLDNSYEMEIKEYDELADLEYIAERCAEEFHSAHDGWEHSWPIDFHLWNESDKLLGIFIVDREAEPVFYARRKKQ
jgi:hypothetical protein